MVFQETVDPSRFREGDLAAKKFLAVCGFYLILVAVVGLVMALKLRIPGFLPFLSVTFLRPAHLQLIIFGWLSMAMMGAFYYIVPREVNRPLVSPALAHLHFILMHVAILAVAVSLLLGYSEGREYLEPILPLDFVVVVIWALFVYNLFATIFTSGLKDGSLKAKPALNFIMVSALYLGVNYLIGMLPLSGVRNNLAIWTFAHNEVNGWFMFGLMGIMYYIIPRLTGTLGQELYNKKLTYVHFWALMVFIPPSVLHHLLYDQAPVNLFWKIAGEWTSVGMLLPTAIWVYIVAVSFKNSKIKMEPAAKFFIAAMIFYALNCIEGSTQAIRVINTFVHGTQWVVGHGHLALLGWISFGIFGTVYYLLPRISKRQIYSSGLTSGHFWLAIIGFLGMFLPLTIAGVIQGSLYADGTSFYSARQAIDPYLVARAVSGSFFGLGAIVFFYNVVKSIGAGMAWQPPEDVRPSLKA